MQKITGEAFFSSVHNDEDKVFDGGCWASASAEPSWCKLVFETTSEVEKLIIGMAGSDVTAAGSCISFSLQLEDNTWQQVAELREFSVNRGVSLMSDMESKGGRIKTQVYSDPFVLNFPKAARVKAFRLDISGHGWFAAEDIQILGSLVK